MQCFEFLGKIAFKGLKSNRNREAIEENLDKITKYLDEDDIFALKLTCRPFYYYFVTADLWTSLKLNIAQDKLQYFEDYDFEEAETKQITKKDKNIRIHSLKKQVESRNPNIAKREPSNVKQKGKIINENNQLLFRNTQIGFKRLLKAGSKKKIGEMDYDMKDVAQLPRVNSLDDYIIKINDPWSTNMSKAQNLVQLFKRINQFHHKFQSELKIPSKQLGQLIKKLKKAEQSSIKYTEIASKDPYLTIIKSVQGAKQNLLIDQQLNKVCRLFWNYHIPMCKIQSQIKSVREVLEKERNKIMGNLSEKSKQAVQFVEAVSGVDQSADLLLNLSESNNQLFKLIAPQIINIYSNILEQMENQIIVFEDTGQQTKITVISWKVLSTKPFFSETLFQILVSITSKLIKLATTLCPDDLTLSITVNRFKSMKAVSQSLLNISKYFGKIKKQVEEKEKKGKEDKTSATIKQFLFSYENSGEQSLYLIKNTAKLQKIITEFKQKIVGIKNKIQVS